MKTIFTWDLGATKCAAAIVTRNSASDFTCVKSFTTKVNQHTSLENLIEAIETGLDFSMSKADAVCIGAAGQFDGSILKLESNYPYLMNFGELAKKRQWPAYAVIHDYAPIVCSTFASSFTQAGKVKRLNTCSMDPHGRRVALGVGTGLGMKDGVLFSNGDFWLGRNEMGHIGISAPAIKDSFYQKRHSELIKFLLSEAVLKPHEALVFERILTGQGLLNLFRFCYPSQAHIKTPEELAQEIYAGRAQEVISLFAWYLGVFTGKVQLTFMPEGGIWITGGVVQNHLNVFEHPEFYAGIESTPGYLNLRKNMPLGVLCGQEHAFIGAAYYASKRLMH